mgnify:CR=1 FL=1
MYVEKIGNRCRINWMGENLVFGPGDFFLSVSLEEMSRVEKGSPSERIMREVYSEAIVKRDEKGYGRQTLWVGYFRAEIPDWTAVFSAAAAHGRRLTVNQFVALSRIIRSENFSLEGEQAHRVISEIYSLTPGSTVDGRVFRFPKATATELKIIRLVKFRDPEFGNQTSLHFVLPKGKMVGQLSGKGGRNIDHLDNVLANVAGIHPFIKAVEIDHREPDAVSV